MVESTSPRSHEDRKKDRKKESRRKTRPQAGPPSPEREKSADGNGVENGVSTRLSDVSTVPPEQIERPGVLSPRQIKAIQDDYRLGFKPKQIEMVTGVKLSTIYKYIQGIEPPVASQEQEENVSSVSNVRGAPASSLSQPAQFTLVPKFIETEVRQDSERRGSEPNGEEDNRETSYKPRLPVPVVNQQAITELILLFGSDMRRKGYTNFLAYFEEYVIPRFEELEFWEGHVPGNTSQEKRHNLTRYLWIAGKYFQLQKEHAEYESANNGVKPES